MHIRKSGTKFKLTRYGGVSGGKNLEVRVGSVPIDTSPDAIPTELLEDLSPKELKALRAVLISEQQEILKSKVSGLVGDLNDLSSSLDSGLLNIASIEDLHKAASRFLKRSRRALPVTKPEIVTKNSP